MYLCIYNESCSFGLLYDYHDYKLTKYQKGKCFGVSYIYKLQGIDIRENTENERDENTSLRCDVSKMAVV